MPHAEESTEFTPDLYPPFPESDDFKSVELQTISLKELLEDNYAEQDRVFEACKVRGFFYLGLAGCETGEIIRNGADDLCRVAERFFKLPQSEKDPQRMLPGSLDG
jgi:isopenicillin N synthase-like dioxygenase